MEVDKGKYMIAAHDVATGVSLDLYIRLMVAQMWAAELQT